MAGHGRLTTWCYHSLRLGLSAVFLVAAAAKWWSFREFVEHVGDYGIVLDAAVGVTAAAICLAELLIGVGLLTGAKSAAWAAALLLAMFMSVLAYGMAIGLDIDCGCFGPGFRVTLPQQMVIDTVLLCVALCCVALRPNPRRPLSSSTSPTQIDQGTTAP